MSRDSSTDTGKSVRELFTAALACSDSGRRRRLLDSECGTDGVLREQVEALLTESSRIGTFLEEPAVSATKAGTSSSRSSAPLAPGEHPGDWIGPYRLVELLGEGGGGSVYRAEQSLPVQRTVALKILKLGMDTKSVIARFEAERQALAMMDHPNIARVLDAGATAEGRPYFVMDFVPGEPITDYCDGHTLNIDERIAIFIKVCRGVEHAHQKGIIHRDLKPSNILVLTRDGEAVPKIIDFGVAKAIDPITGHRHDVTRFETIIGTPAYMSPEQAERDCLDIDTRCDVYSLGTLLHELLTGFTPLDSHQVAQAGIDELRRTFRALVPTRPSVRLQSAPLEDRPRIEIDRSTRFDRLTSRLRGDLDWIVLKCLETERSHRFGSAHELACDLECYLAGEPVTARPPSTTYRLQKFVRRHRRPVAAGALLLMTLIAAVGISTALAIRATRAERNMRDAHRVQSELRTEAVRDREEALRSAAIARRNQYVADINVSRRALADGNIAEALQLLDRHASPEAGGEDLRGFEWSYLAGLCLGDEHRSLPQQDSAIESLAFSRDGQRLVICTRNDLLVWDFATDQPFAAFPGSVSAAAFFPDGRRLAATSRDGLWIHDLESSEPPMLLTDEGGDLALSPDGLLLASTGRSGVTIWNTQNWTRWNQLPRCSGPLTFSPDGDNLATGARDGITLWSMRKAGDKLVLAHSPTSFRGGFPGGKSNLFSPDGTSFIAALNLKPNRNGYFLGVWDTRSGEELGTLPGTRGAGGHAGIVSAASFDAAGSLLATSSWDHSVRLWDFAERRVTQTLQGHRGEVWSVALSPDGEVVASGSKNGEIKIWPTVQIQPKEGIDGRWKPLSYSADSTYLAAQNREGVISIFNLRSQEAVHSIMLSAGDSRFGRHAASLSRDLTTLAEGKADGSVSIRKLDEEKQHSFPVAERRVNFVALSPAADTLVTVGWRDDLAWWDLAAPSDPIVRTSGSHALFSVDGSTLAMANRDGFIVVWDTATRRERARITHRAQASASSLALSPNGAILAMSHGFEDFENAISLWDTTTGNQLGTLSGHKQGIWSIAFSPDGKTLASSSGGGTLRFWNVASQRELMTIREPGANLTDLQFSPDGQYLVAGSPNFSSSAKLRIIHAPPIEFNEPPGEIAP